MRDVRAGTMAVTFHDGHTELIEADKKQIDSDGNLILYAAERIAGYPCPLRLMTVATYAKGAWKSVRADFQPIDTEPKEPDEPQNTGA